MKNDQIILWRKQKPGTDIKQKKFQIYYKNKQTVSLLYMNFPFLYHVKRWENERSCDIFREYRNIALAYNILKVAEL